MGLYGIIVLYQIISDYICQKTLTSLVDCTHVPGRVIAIFYFTLYVYDAEIGQNLRLFSFE